MRQVRKITTFRRHADLIWCSQVSRCQTNQRQWFTAIPVLEPWGQATGRLLSSKHS